MSEIIVIVAVSENNVIGKNGKIPWHIEEDLQRFKKLTMNHPVIMGRKTFESLPVKPLKNRINIVLTRQKDFKPDSVIIKESLEDAINYCKDQEKIFIIGGQSVYEEGIKIADTLELTKVKGNYDGDAFFPQLESNQWSLVNRQDRNGYSFLTYKRRK